MEEESNIRTSHLRLGIEIGFGWFVLSRFFWSLLGSVFVGVTMTTIVTFFALSKVHQQFKDSVKRLPLLQYIWNEDTIGRDELHIFRQKS